MFNFLSAFGPALKDQHWSMITVSLLIGLATVLLHVTGNLEIATACIYLAFAAAYFLLILGIAVFAALLLSAGFRATKVSSAISQN